MAGWVWKAFEAKKELRVVWRDREMSLEWTNEWCGGRALKEMRIYEEEVEVQARRRGYREGLFAWNTGIGVIMPGQVRKRILLQEEEVCFLEERERFWKRRRTPC